MPTRIHFFPVGNGDMTLIELESGKRLLIDVNIRAAADDLEEQTPDVATLLRDRLERDTQGRLYVDAFLLSHPDQDHCAGLKKHFHLGDASTLSADDDKILIRELWSSPMAFRRASRHHKLCADAKAFNKEARRRVKLFREGVDALEDGNRILILGRDEDGKTDGLEEILVPVGDSFNRINGEGDTSFSARLLGPQPPTEDSDGPDTPSKNDSSVILQFLLAGDGESDQGRFLTGGDAEVGVWEALWDTRTIETDWLTYDLLQAPHHCSWHSLSHDSWSEKREAGTVSANARSALSQASVGATIVASSKAIKDDDNDPPCVGAKRVYEEIVAGVHGEFVCVGEPENAPQVVTFEINEYGLRRPPILVRAASAVAGGVMGGQPLSHG